MERRGCRSTRRHDRFGSTTTGTATLQTSLPNTPPLVGVTFYQQMIPFELDGNGNVGALIETNALQLTAGRF